MGIKQGERVSIYQPLSKFIEQTLGHDAASQLDAPLRNFQQTRDELLKTTSFRIDSPALEGLISNTNSYISMWTCIEKNLPFGPDKVRSRLNI